VSTTLEVTVEDLANRLKVDPKDLRKWLRADGKGVGGTATSSRNAGARYPQSAGPLSRYVSTRLLGSKCVGA
jgi:hypothetical protein